MKSLWKQVQDLTFEIAAEVDHGECFYETADNEKFNGKLDRLKELSKKLLEENQNDE